MANQQHIELTLAKVQDIFNETSTRIEALKPGERLVLTAFARSIAHKYGVSGTTLYQTIHLLTNNYPGTKMHRGPKGGLEKLPTND